LGKIMRDLVQAFDEIGELKKISGAGDDEIGAITELNAKQERSSALLFDDIPGHPKGYRLLSGTLDSPRRLGLALGINAHSTAEIIHHVGNGKLRQWINAAAEFDPDIVEESELRCVSCGEGGLNVESFPAPRWHAEDGGRYIGTACSVLTHGPDGGWVNVGSYRVMVQGPNAVTIFFATSSRHGRGHIEAWWREGKPAPVAVILGGLPLLSLLAGVEVPTGISELGVLGAAQGKRVAARKSSITGLPIPVDSELVLEGFISKDDLAEEGPFGEFTGYYAGGKHFAPVLRVSHIWTRDDPIILGACPSKPPQDFEYPFSVFRSAMLQDAITASGVTGVVGVWTSFCRQWIVVSVKQSHPGHAKQAAWVAANCGPGGYLARYIIAVDDDIDPTNTAEVLWALMTRSNPETDIDLARGTWGSPIDPMGKLFPEGTSYNSRAVIDASIPFTKRGLFPPVVQSSPEILKRVFAQWGHVFNSKPF
jgi:UbiD family decarboxylase